MLERPPVHAPRAVVATSHPLASEAAVAVLRRGGTAADAAVAAGAALTVLEPWASHIGGDAFALLWDAASRKVRAVQGSGIAPRAIDAAGLVAAGSTPLRGGTAITVPGMVGAWFHLLETRGRLPAAELLAPAIRLARDGFPIGRRWEVMVRLQRRVIESDPELRALFLPEGGAPRAGDWVRQPNLAQTLEKLADEGAGAFYGGPLGRTIVKEIRARGGAMSIEDLRAHRTLELDPLRIDLEGQALPGRVSILEQPPVSQGAMVLAVLKILEQAERGRCAVADGDFAAIAREIHLEIEAYRAVRSDRERWLCDPDFARSSLDVELSRWFSTEDAAATLSGIDPDRASTAPPVDAAAAERGGRRVERRGRRHRRGDQSDGTKPGRRGARSRSLPEPRDTTYLCIVDVQGNAVSWIQSIFHPFGAGWMVPGTGILLNNRMAAFSPDSGSPNRLEAGKRPVHTLNSWIVLRDGEPWLIGGTPGAEAQVTLNVQLLRARLARSIPLAEALRMPRWQIDPQNRVCLEGRFPREVRRRLERRGHNVVRLGPWEGTGFVQAIERLDGGGWLACTDPRGEGLAIGF